MFSHTRLQPVSSITNVFKYLFRTICPFIKFYAQLSHVRAYAHSPCAAKRVDSIRIVQWLTIGLRIVEIILNIISAGVRSAIGPPVCAKFKT